MNLIDSAKEMLKSSEAELQKIDTLLNKALEIESMSGLISYYEDEAPNRTEKQIKDDNEEEAFWRRAHPLNAKKNDKQNDIAKSCVELKDAKNNLESLTEDLKSTIDNYQNSKDTKVLKNDINMVNSHIGICTRDREEVKSDISRFNDFKDKYSKEEYPEAYLSNISKDMIEFDKHSESTIDITQMASLENTNLVIDEDQNTRA